MDCSLCPWNSPGKITGGGSHSLLQEIFLTQELNLGVLQCRQFLYDLIHQGIHTFKSSNTIDLNFLMGSFVLFCFFSEYFSQFSSFPQSCPILCYPMACSTPVLPVHHQLPEFIQTHVHWVGGAIQPSHPLSSISPPAFNLSQHQGLFNESVLRIRWPQILEFQL